MRLIQNLAKAIQIQNEKNPLLINAMIPKKKGHKYYSKIIYERRRKFEGKMNLLPKQLKITVGIEIFYQNRSGIFG